MAETITDKTKTALPLQHYRFKGRYSNIGLDLGSAQIKVVQFKKRKGQISLHRYGIFPLPHGVIEGGRITDPLVLALRLQQHLRRRRFHRNRVNLCIGSQSVIQRQILMPAMSAKEVPQAIRWEAEKHVMFPLDETVIDYSYLGERVVDGKTASEVLLVAAHKEVVNGYIDVIARAGLYPEVIEIEPFALHRSIHRGAGSNEFSLTGNLLVLDIGGDSTNLLVLEGGKYSFSRILNVGVHHFLRKVAETASVNLGKARQMLFDTNALVLEGALQVADDLVRQIRRTLEYYALEMWRQDKEFTEMMLCGGGASIPGLNTFLGHELKIEPKLYNPLDGVEYKTDYREKDLARDSGMLQIASGLALRGWLV